VSKILSVFWHGIASDSLRPRLDSKDPQASTFRAQIEFLARNYSPISIWDFLDISDGKRSSQSLVKPPVLLGFDDGFRSVVLRGLPILTEMGIPAVLFVVADVIANPDFIPWFVERKHLIQRAHRARIQYRGVALNLSDRQDREKARKLSEAAYRSARSDLERENVLAELSEVVGIRRPAVDDLDDDLRFITEADLAKLDHSGVLTVASHAATHRHLADLDNSDQMDELLRADSTLRKYSASYCPVIAYPAGSFNVDTLTIAQRIYRAGFAVFAGASHANRYAYPRVGLGRETGRELAYAISAVRLNVLMPLKKWLYAQAAHRSSG